MSALLFPLRGEQSLITLLSSLYRVRRLFTANPHGAKGTVYRCVEQIEQFDLRLSALAALLRYRPLGSYEEIDGIAYVCVERCSETELPIREELFSIAPATVQTKARYGVPWFDSKWHGGRLFPNCRNAASSEADSSLAF